jgi:hypothetical protein
VAGATATSVTTVTNVTNVTNITNITRRRFFCCPVFVGAAFGFGVWPFWWDPFWFPPPYPAYTYAPPVVIQQEPQVYVEPSTPTYWYYCADAKAYYPYARECPGGWLKVVPTPAS